MINMNNITDLDINKSYYMNYSTIQNISVINLFLNENNENKTDINIEDEIAKLNEKIKIIPQYKNMRLSFNNVTNTKFIKLCQLVKYLNYQDIGDFFMNLYKYAYNLHYDMLYNFNNIYDTIIKKRYEIGDATRSCVCQNTKMFMRIKKYKQFVVWNDYYDIAVKYAILDAIVVRNKKYNASYESSCAALQSNFNIFNIKIKLISIIKESKALKLANSLLIHEINVFKEIQNMYTINNLDKILLE